MFLRVYVKDTSPQINSTSSLTHVSWTDVCSRDVSAVSSSLASSAAEAAAACAWLLHGFYDDDDQPCSAVARRLRRMRLSLRPPPVVLTCDTSGCNSSVIVQLSSHTTVRRSAAPPLLFSISYAHGHATAPFRPTPTIFAPEQRWCRIRRPALPWHPCNYLSTDSRLPAPAPM